MCPSCQDLDVEFAIRTPGELATAIRIAQANVADGTLEPLEPQPGRLLGDTPPIASINSDGPWADFVFYLFHCPTCGTQFELSAETYHGGGGSWHRRHEEGAV
jgi:hypothetical protein